MRLIFIVLLNFEQCHVCMFLHCRPKMDSLKSPFKGVTRDIKERLPCYKQDWKEACSGLRYNTCCNSPTAKLIFLSANLIFSHHSYQDIGSNCIYFLCFCSSCYCIWRAVEQGNRYPISFCIDCRIL